MNKRDLLAFYLSGTYCHKTGTRSPSCVTPLQPTINTINLANGMRLITRMKKDHLEFALRVKSLSRRKCDPSGLHNSGCSTFKKFPVPLPGKFIQIFLRLGHIVAISINSWPSWSIKVSSVMSAIPMLDKQKSST